MHHNIPTTHYSFYVDLLHLCSKNGASKLGKSVHARLIVHGLATSLHFASKLIAFYARCKHLTDARKLFDEIPKTSIRGWVAAIGSFARNGYYQETMDMFQQMQTQGFKHDKIILPSVLKSCGHLSDPRTGEKIHTIVLKNEFESDAFVMCALVDMYSKCRMIEKANRVFNSMPGKDLVSLNTMVSGYVLNGCVKEAFALVERMKSWGIEPDIMTYNSLISGFSQANNETMIKKVFKIMETDGIKPDVVSWTSVISGFVQNFKSNEAYSTFRLMMQSGVSPRASTISGLLPASANTADLRTGKEIHGYSVIMGYEKDVYVRTALIDMYAKCGLISEAMALFQDMSERTSVTWNSMIFACANHGYCDEAIELFNQMVKVEERKLDHLTFTAVLTACSHGGMVDLGEGLFKLMQEKYEIVARLEHYACMVDLLGRAGKVDEAYGVIRRMPIEPDLFVWGALLGACRQHNWLDLAEVAAKELGKLEPKSSGSSVVLSGLYAEYSRWENATEMKKMTKKKKLRSFSGCSWIQDVDVQKMSFY